jgi:hypothetical protein
MCFKGARQHIQSQSHIDSLLSPKEDINTLLERQENYRAFQNSYFTGQERTWTPDGLGYVSHITIGDVQLAVVGLDSAWLAEGGWTDHGKLLIGERQAINALNLASTFNPNIIIAMAHHPFHVLQEFDRRPVQNRIERGCHFFHCGHLHEPEARNIGRRGSSCLTLTAGASFETRHSHNAYSLVTLDLLRAQCEVKTFQYNPADGAFSFISSDEEYPVEITPAGTCGVGELAHAMKAYRPSLSPLAHYLSALLLEQKSDFPIPNQNGHAFGSFAVLQTLPDSDLKRKTIDFLTFKNVLRIFYKRIPLPDLFVRHGHVIEQYGAALEELCNAQPALRARLADQEKDAQAMADATPQESHTHTALLFADLAAAQEWGALREQAERHLNSLDQKIATHAKRMLALGLANSEETTDRSAAINLYQSLIRENSAEPSDAGNLATLLIDAKNFEVAKTIVLDAMAKFPTMTEHLYQIGLRIVEATGDRDFRKQLETAIQARSKRG